MAKSWPTGATWAAWSRSRCRCLAWSGVGGAASTGDGTGKLGKVFFQRNERNWTVGAAAQQQPPEPDGEQQRPPQSLGHPARQPEDVAEEEEGAVREQVAVGLVLRLAERQLAVPQVERARQEPQRVGGEIELGVRRDLARRLRERQGQRYRRDQPEPAASKGRRGT